MFSVGNNLVLTTDRILVGVKPGATKIAALLKKFKGAILQKKGLEYVVQLEVGVDPVTVAEQLANEETCGLCRT